MSARTVEREWLSVAEAGQYVGISSEVVRAAALSGALPAYEKPVTRGRKVQGPAQPNTFMKISKSDLDAWVRSWPRIGGDAA